MLRITILRKWNVKKDDGGYCIGKIYANGEELFETLEDYDRGLKDEMPLEEIKARKVYGKTAIPTGIYELILNYSPKYKKVMPLLLNVKGYSGVRIHSGNTEKDTEGCILVGWNKKKGMVIDSRKAYDILMKKIEQHKGDKIIVEIRRMFYA